MRRQPQDSRLDQLPCLDGIAVLRAVYSHHVFVPHAHDTFVIGVVSLGACVVNHPARSHRITPERVLVIPPGVIHSARGDDHRGWHYHAIYPSRALMTAIVGSEVERALAAAPTPIAVIDPAVAHFAVGTLQELSDLPHSDPLDETASRLRELIASVAGAAADQEAPAGSPAATNRCTTERIARARQYVDDHPTDDITLEALADLAGLSVFQFVRSFARELGITPYAYFLQRRIHYAQGLLELGLPASVVAHRCGFADQSHFIRQFRRVVGVTPRWYRGHVDRPA